MESETILLWWCLFTYVPDDLCSCLMERPKSARLVSGGWDTVGPVESRLDRHLHPRVWTDFEKLYGVFSIRLEIHDPHLKVVNQTATIQNIFNELLILIRTHKLASLQWNLHLFHFWKKKVVSFVPAKIILINQHFVIIKQSLVIKKLDNKKSRALN